MRVETDTYLRNKREDFNRKKAFISNRVHIFRIKWLGKQHCYIRVRFKLETDITNYFPYDLRNLKYKDNGDRYT